MHEIERKYDVHNLDGLQKNKFRILDEVEILDDEILLTR